MNLMDQSGITQGMLQDTFGEKDTSKVGTPLSHPDGENIINQAIEILNKTPSGRALVTVKEHFNVPIKVVKGKEITFNLPDEETVFLFVNPTYKQNIEIVALALGAGIREAEHMIMGFRRPAGSMDPIDHATITFSKALDIIKTMCELARDINKELKSQKVVDFMVNLGHGEFYTALTAEAPFDELKQVLYDSIYKEK